MFMGKRQNDKANKSLERRKKTATSLMKLFGKEACNVLPGGSFLFEIGDAFIEHVWHFQKDRKKSRIEDFHKTLFKGVPEKDYESLLSEEFSIEDYYTLLSNAIQDDEDAKTKFYSNMFKALMKNQIPAEYKLHFIKAVRELSCRDIEKMQEIYIYSKNEIKHGGYAWGASNSLKADPIENISNQALERLGFIEMKRPSEEYDFKNNGPKELKYPFETELTPPLIEILFSPEELTPKSIGKESWKKMPPVFILTNDLSKHPEAINAVTKSLEQLNIKNEVVVPDVHDRTGILPIYNSNYLILCLDYSLNVSVLHVETFVTQPQIKDKKFINVFLSEFKGESYDPIPEVTAISSFKFTPKEKYEIDEFKNFMKIETENFE
jgi:hypothetical protein